MISKDFNETPGNCDVPHSSTKSEYRIYANAACAIRQFYSGIPLSVICTNHELGIVYRSEMSTRYIPLAASFTKIMNGLGYYKITVHGEREHPRVNESRTPKLGALLLPAVTLKGFETEYNGHPNSAVVFSNWMYYNTPNVQHEVFYRQELRFGHYNKYTE